MARNFAGIITRPYIGVPVQQPVGLCTPARSEPAIIPFYIPAWSIYQIGGGPMAGVAIDLSAGGVNVTLDRIVSVYIDNLGSDVPVYVYFPDTRYTIPAKPGSVNWYKAVTNSKVVQIFAEGLTPGDLSATNVMFSNIAMDTFSNTEIDQSISLLKASPIITNGTTIYNTDYGAGALGDQIASFDLNISVAGTIQPVFPAAPGFFAYITSISVLAYTLTAPGAPASRQVNFENTLGVVKLPIVFNPTNNQFAYNLLNLSSMNVKLDLTDQWQLRVVNALVDGIVTFSLAFTISPV